MSKGKARKSRRGVTVRLDVRAASLATAAGLALGGGAAFTVLLAKAWHHPGARMDLGLTLLGVAGAVMLLAALIILGFTVVARVVGEKIDAHAKQTRAQLSAHMARLEGEVDAYQAGMGRAIDVFKQALPPKLPANVVPFPSTGRDFADAN